jgi:hypothetical protein
MSWSAAIEAVEKRSIGTLTDWASSAIAPGPAGILSKSKLGFERALTMMTAMRRSLPRSIAARAFGSAMVNSYGIVPSQLTAAAATGTIAVPNPARTLHGQ